MFILGTAGVQHPWKCSHL